MWDLTVPGNNDHDFYVVAGTSIQGSGHHMYHVVAGNTPVLVHNDNPVTPNDCQIGVQGMSHLTSGILDVQVEEVPFASGPEKGLGGFRDDMGRVPGMTESNFHHVEMQAAAYMRLNNIEKGVLYINHPDGICDFCSGNAYTPPGGPPVFPIEDALPEGAGLWVYGKFGNFLGRFIGNSK
jgi:SCP1.201-like deaminase